MKGTLIGCLFLQILLLIIAIASLYMKIDFSAVIAAIAGVNIGLIIKALIKRPPYQSNDNDEIEDGLLSIFDFNQP